MSAQIIKNVVLTRAARGSHIMFIGFKQEKKPVNYEILKILLRHSLSASASNDSGTTLDLVLFLCRLIFLLFISFMVKKRLQKRQQLVCLYEESACYRIRRKRETLISNIDLNNNNNFSLRLSTGEPSCAFLCDNQQKSIK